MLGLLSPSTPARIRRRIVEHDAEFTFLCLAIVKEFQSSPSSCLAMGEALQSAYCLHLPLPG